jgi:transposase
MSIVVLKLPEVKPSNETRPQACPYCSRETFLRWGGKRKAVKDHRLKEVVDYRYRCYHCHRSFRHYQEGVDRARQTQRLRKLAAIAWVLGISLRGVSLILSAFEVELSHMTVDNQCQVYALPIRFCRIHLSAVQQQEYFSAKVSQSDNVSRGIQ